MNSLPILPEPSSAMAATNDASAVHSTSPRGVTEPMPRWKRLARPVFHDGRGTAFDHSRRKPSSASSTTTIGRHASASSQCTGRQKRNARPLKVHPSRRP